MYGPDFIKISYNENFNLLNKNGTYYKQTGFKMEAVQHVIRV